MSFCVYLHKNKENEVIYVGKCKGDRWRKPRSSNVKWCDLIGDQGFDAEVIFRTHCEVEAFNVERLGILHFKSLGQAKANTSNGTSRRHANLDFDNLVPLEKSGLIADREACDSLKKLIEELKTEKGNTDDRQRLHSDVQGSS